MKNCTSVQATRFTTGMWERIQLRKGIHMKVIAGIFAVSCLLGAGYATPASAQSSVTQASEDSGIVVLYKPCPAWLSWLCDR